MDDSAYRNAIQNVQSDTKKVVASLSSEYSKAAKSVAELTLKYNDSVSKTGKTSKETKELKTQLAAAQAQLRATTSALKSANTSMAGFGDSAKSAGASLTSAFAKGQMLGNMLTSLGAKALSAAESFVQTGIEYNAQIEKYTTGFTNMLGSAEAAQQTMAAIQEDAAKTPFNVEALTQANQLLISAGENAGYSRKVIMALGNAVNAAGGGNAELSRMAANLQQIANVGKAASIDIKQFAYAGINIYQVLADYTGKSVQEVQNMTISYDTLSQALIAASEEGGRYYGAMETQSQTMNGRVSTLQDNVKQLAGLMTSNLTDSVGVVISKLNDMTVAAIEAYKQDGWWAMAGAALSTVEPIGQIGSAIDGVLSKARELTREFSYWVSSKTVPNFAYGSYEEFSEALDSNERRTEGSRQKERNRRRYLHNKRVSEARAAAASNESSVTGDDDDDDDDTGKKSSGSKTETVIASVSSTVSTTAQNALGNVTTSIETLQEKVKDASGNIKDRVTTTTTETGKEMVNGVATTYKIVETKVNGIVTKTTKVYDDMSKTLTETATRTATKTVQGVTTAISEVTEKYADGTEHIKTTETKTQEVIVDGVAQTVKTITTYIDGVKDKVQTTTEEVERTVLASQNRIDQYTSELGQEMGKGIFGLASSLISNLKNQSWSGVAQDITKLIFGEVNQNQRETIMNWLTDAAEAVNEEYAGGGLRAGLQSIADVFENGITPAADKSYQKIESLMELLNRLSAMETNGGLFTKILNLVGGTSGTVAGGAGAAAGTAAVVSNTQSMATGIISSLGSIVSFISANPVVAAILGLTALVGGVAFSSMSKNKDSVTNNYESPFSKTPVYDSLAEFSYRADQFNRYKDISTSTFANSWQDSTGKQQVGILQRISDTLDEHLPAIGTGQLVIDANGVQALAGAMQPTMTNGVDEDLGIRAIRKARGN